MSPVTPKSTSLRLLAALALGALVFAGGIALARAWLPAWLGVRLPDERFFAERYRELANRAGFQLVAGAPRLTLTGRDEELSPDDTVSDRLSPQQAAAAGEGLLVRVAGSAFRPSAKDRVRELAVRFLPSGEPVIMGWGGLDEIVKETLRQGRPASAPELTAVMRLLVRPGERLGPGARVPLSKSFGDAYPLLGSDPPQRLLALSLPGGLLLAARQPGGPKLKTPSAADAAGAIVIGLVLVTGCIAATVLFVVLAARHQIGLINGLILGAVALAASAVSSFGANPGLQGALEMVGGVFLAGWAFLLWSTGESYLRSERPELIVGLDALRLGRLGPRGARSLLDGVALGALLAGLRLGALALASRVHGLWPQKDSLNLPLFGTQTPLFDGIVLAGGVAFAIGLAARWVPARWAPWAAALAGGLALPFVNIHPAWLQAAVGCTAAGLLVLLCRRAGLAACLIAALSACLLQTAAFSAAHLAWLPWTFAAAAGAPALFLVLGFVGLRRPARAELERIEPPAFMKRLDEERRLKYEMDLLARMQLGLLPAKLPEIAGWEIAVRSLLATEAGGDLYDFLQDEEGRLWIAAGDVAGHGYSCSISQAMTTAALASLVAAGKTPAEVLGSIDRVIRRGSQRNFTSLALVCLDPGTGEALMSNAGHPFPLLLLGAAGSVEEIDLPGLPLGQGPPRTYADVRFDIPPGSSLVFSSDGLFESADWRESLYGYERPRELLRDLGDRSAAEILEALFADWRRHLGGREHQDDTTVVVLKRL
jgi:hypothetical protein